MLEQVETPVPAAEAASSGKEIDKVIRQMEEELQAGRPTTSTEERAAGADRLSSRKRSMRQPIDGVRRVLAVASGKGGVGKTTVAVNVALALAEQARVGVFDADLYGPNVPLMLGVRRRGATHGGGFVPVARATSTPYIQPLVRHGLKLMSIGFVVGERETVLPDSRFAGTIVTQMLQDVVWGDVDYLLIDLPPGTGEPQQSLVNEVQIDGVLVVTTPQDLSLLDSSRALGLFRQAGIPILGVIENMSYLICPHCHERIEVFQATRQGWAVQDQALELLGRVPMDGSISRGIDAGHPLVQAMPGAAAADIFRGIATRVARKLPAE